MMPVQTERRIFKMSPLLIMLAVLLAFFYTRGFFGNPKSKIIFSDGIGYYAYLPANLIFHDQSYSFLDKVSRDHYDGAPAAGLYEFRREVDGRFVNQFFAGTALLMAPFFLIAHLLSILCGLPADGFSLFYQYFIAIGSICYLGLGCLLLFRLMRRLKISQGISALSLVLIVFATNLYHYAIYEPAMSHVYSFMAISGFLLYAIAYFQTLRPTDFFKAAFFFGIVLLIRPSNCIILLLIPFAAGSWQALSNGIRHLFKKNLSLPFSILIIVLICCIQCWLWHQQTGQWFIWSYTGQTFNFSEPHILQVLFSFKKGFFLYTPLAAFSLLGLLWFFKNNRFMFFSAVIFLFIAVYIISSWWNWWYGMSYGHRAFIDHYALFAVLLAYTFSMMTTRISKIICVVLCSCFLLLNQVQAYQYRYYILHWEMMTAQKYKQVFLKTGKEYRGLLWKESGDKK